MPSFTAPKNIVPQNEQFYIKACIVTSFPRPLVAGAHDAVTQRFVVCWRAFLALPLTAVWSQSGSGQPGLGRRARMPAHTRFRDIICCGVWSPAPQGQASGEHAQLPVDSLGKNHRRSGLKGSRLQPEAVRSGPPSGLTGAYQEAWPWCSIGPGSENAGLWIHRAVDHGARLRGSRPARVVSEGPAVQSVFARRCGSAVSPLLVRDQTPFFHSRTQT